MKEWERIEISVDSKWRGRNLLHFLLFLVWYFTPRLVVSFFFMKIFFFRFSHAYVHDTIYESYIVCCTWRYHHMEFQYVKIFRISRKKSIDCRRRNIKIQKSHFHSSPITPQMKLTPKMHATIVRNFWQFDFERRLAKLRRWQTSERRNTWSKKIWNLKSAALRAHGLSQKLSSSSACAWWQKCWIGAYKWNWDFLVHEKPQKERSWNSTKIFDRLFDFIIPTNQTTSDLLCCETLQPHPNEINIFLLDSRRF